MGKKKQNQKKNTIAASVPVTDGHQKIFRRWWKELEISNVQLFDLNGLTELNDKPEQREGQKIKGKKYNKKIKNPAHGSVNLPYFVATGI